MDKIMLPIQRLALYREAIKQIKEGDFSISFPYENQAEQMHAFESEFIQLAAWLDIRFEEFNKIQEISTEISKGSVLDDVLNRIYDTFHKAIPYDRIGCALISDDQKKVISHWTKTNYPQKIKINKGYTAPLAGSSLENILLTQQPRIINDLKKYLTANPKSSSTKLIISEGIQSSLTCPLIVEGKPIGFLFFSSKKKDTYIDSHQKTFINIARQVSILIEKSRLYQHIYDINQKLTKALEQIKEQSARDALTGIFNRGAIMELLQNAVEQGKRKKHPVAVILADIDYFKKINDTHGHIMGDKVLMEVSKNIANNLRIYDCIGRYGGEEFLIILNESDAAEALLIADRIRQSVSSIKFKHNENTFSVTMSFGISYADFINHSKKEEELLQEADSELYRAKNEGRNRVCIAK